ncbi:protein-L-isoaspartate(D-aspartate) O-methyltransferase [Planctomyces sp. SH-PL14]|uniref:protein-L-isoaspartate(D-aspartate) O-methyltransferase n=1 Tax=Planctomyces sp. SH-PL14 TaxID=1632864 RepID=UPI00078E60E6|nr:protein-L-isoaspartate(D-aspartate) O-methyltransferase [Planctomyces sp. SH-PL14]AMV18775.1 Protein-L-isoaspartate O-methyltransferase [Planctomyces sp. SH-PL14]
MSVPVEFRRSLEERGIRDPRVLEAMARVPREEFVPTALWARAYEDRALPIEAEQTISQPYVVAWMTEQLRLSGTETVLEVGTGSGYQTAILAELVGRVVTIERVTELARTARERLEGMGYSNIEFHVGDGTRGWGESGPYDGILVAAGTAEVPRELVEQLRVGGRLVIPVGVPTRQVMKLVQRVGEGLTVRDLGGCVFVPLIRDPE